MSNVILTVWFGLNLIAYWRLGTTRRTLTFTPEAAIAASVVYSLLIWAAWS